MQISFHKEISKILILEVISLEKEGRAREGEKEGRKKKGGRKREREEEEEEEEKSRKFYLLWA